MSEDETDATLEKNGNRTAQVLEFMYVNCYVLTGEGHSDTDDTTWYWPWDSLHGPARPDFSAHIGFVFSDNLSGTNLSASTIAGGGDFFSDISIGLPLCQHVAADQRHEFSLELGGGFSTDKDFLQVHPNICFGLGYEVSFAALHSRSFGPTNELLGFMSVRAGGAVIDGPQVTGTDVGDNKLHVRVKEGLPQFGLRLVPGFNVTLAYPLTRAIYATVGANIYPVRSLYDGGNGPDQWNVTVGAAIPIDEVGRAFGRFFTVDPRPKL